MQSYNKKVMIVLSREENLSCDTGYVDDGKLYVIHKSYPILLVYDLRDFSYRVVTHNVMPYEYVQYGVRELFKIKNRLYIIPSLRVRTIIVYDLSTDRYWIHKAFKDEVDCGGTYRAYLQNDSFYLCSLDLRKGILKADIEEADGFTVVSPEWDDVFGDKENDLLGWYFIGKGGIFAFPYGTDKVFRFSMKGEIIQSYNLAMNDVVEDVSYDGKIFYFVRKKDAMIFAWDPESEIQGKCRITKFKASNREKYIGSSSVNKDLFTCIFREIGRVDFINLQTGSELRINLDKFFSPEMPFSNAYSVRGMLFDRKLLLLPNVAENFILIDIDTGIAEVISCKLRDMDIATAKSLKYQNQTLKQIYEENEENTLKGFIGTLRYQS